MRLPFPSVLRNPIFEREFVAMCRTRRWFVIRTLFVGVMVLFLAAFFGANLDDFTPGRLDKLGRVLFAALSFALVLGVFFATPGMVADLVVTERRKDTLEILLTTPLRPFGIIFGKLASRLALLLTMVAACFPVVSVTLLFGGVRGEQLVGLFVVSLGTMLLLAGPALLISTLSRRLGTAAVLSYVLPVVYHIVLPIAALWLSRRFGWSDERFFEIAASAHAFLAAGTVALDEVYGMLAKSAPPYLSFLAFGAGMSVVCTLLSVLVLGRERKRRGFGGHTVDRTEAAERDLHRLRGQVARLAATARDPEEASRLLRIAKEVERCLAEIRRPRAEGDGRPAGMGATRMRVAEAVRGLEAKIEALGIPPASRIAEQAAKARRGRRRVIFRGMRNPMLWKEAHLINATHSRALFFVVLAVLLLGEIIALTTCTSSQLADEPVVHAMLVTLESFILLILVGVNGATSVIGEREQGTLDILRVTLLRPVDIVSGKVAGTLRSVLALAAIPVLHLLVAVPFTKITIGSVLGFTFVLAVLLAFFAVSGTRSSIVASKGSRAILRTMGLIGFIVLGMPILAGIVMLTTASTGSGVLEFLLMSNPAPLLYFPVAYLAEGQGSSADDSLVAYTVVWVIVYIVVGAVRYLLLPSTYLKMARREAR